MKLKVASPFSNHITKPAALRYLWTNYPEYPVSLYSRYGLPVAPFSAKKK